MCKPKVHRLHARIWMRPPQTARPSCCAQLCTLSCPPSQESRVQKPGRLLQSICRFTAGKNTWALQSFTDKDWHSSPSRARWPSIGLQTPSNACDLVAAGVHIHAVQSCASLVLFFSRENERQVSMSGPWPGALAPSSAHIHIHERMIPVAEAERQHWQTHQHQQGQQQQVQPQWLLTQRLQVEMLSNTQELQQQGQIQSPIASPGAVTHPHSSSSSTRSM
jgi:hypothetical protein